MGGDVDAVDEKQFRYPGPKPCTKESVILMIADTVEAASRSMDEVTEDSLQELVERLVSDKAEEGQFDECQLTFEELGIVKKKIIKTLSITRHLRVKYPEKKISRKSPAFSLYINLQSSFSFPLCLSLHFPQTKELHPQQKLRT